MLSITKSEIENSLDKFIWNYKVGDNIKHNLEEVFYLYNVKKTCSTTTEHRFLNKHISITLVAIIEAVLYDFIVRLNDATNQFPKSIDYDKRKNIKKYITAQKVFRKLKDSTKTIHRVRNYSLTQIINLLQEFELLGGKEDQIYYLLNRAIQFRNRLHIYNWFDNFEKDEEYVFTLKRLEILERLTIKVLIIMKDLYTR